VVVPALLIVALTMGTNLLFDAALDKGARRGALARTTESGGTGGTIRRRTVKEVRP
jgi:peptide/nickel transport system permease protein